MTVYKITDKDMETGHEYKLTKWKIGVPVEPGKSEKLDVHKWLHEWLYAYEHPLLAVLHNPIHANYKNGYRLFEAEAEGETETKSQMMLSCTKLTLIKEIEVPKITVEQKLAYGILCIKSCFKNRRWNIWANNWLSGKDRSNESAENVLKYIKNDIKYCSACDLVYCVIDKIDCTDLFKLVANAACNAKISAIILNPKLDLVKLAKQALTINSTDGATYDRL
jgi:hypothetical protein